MYYVVLILDLEIFPVLVFIVSLLCSLFLYLAVLYSHIYFEYS